MSTSTTEHDSGNPVAETVEQLSRMHEAHSAQTSLLQRSANKITGVLGRPAAFLVFATLIVCWVVGNVVAPIVGRRAIDGFPFAGIELFATIAALLIALLILSTQRHQDRLADRRAHLTLQLASLSEKKIAKVIELLEQQRNDNPLLPNSNDATAQEMSKPVDASGDLGADPKDPV